MKFIARENKEKTLSPMSEQSLMLMRKFRLEMARTGKSSVTCPVCGQKLVITTSSEGERTTIACKCGYLFDGECNL